MGAWARLEQGSRTVATWGYTMGMSAAAYAYALVTTPEDAWRAFRGRWAWSCLRILGTRLDIVGAERLEAQAAVIACNHQSMLDVVAVPAFVPEATRFIAKKELSKIPLWGWMLSRAGGVMIDRKNSRDAVEAIRRGMATLPQGWSVVVFPEGTRSATGELRPFKKGVCHMAVAAGLPVLPVGMDGAFDLLPLADWKPRPGTVYVTVGEPIDTRAWNPRQPSAHLPDVYEAVRRCVERSRERRIAAEGTGNITSLAEARRRA